MPRTELRLLVFTQPVQPVVSLAGCSHLVLVRAVQDPEYGQQQDSALAGEVDGVSRVVGGRIARYIRPASTALAFIRSYGAFIGVWLETDVKQEGQQVLT